MRIRALVLTLLVSLLFLLVGVGCKKPAQGTFEGDPPANPPIEPAATAVAPEGTPAPTPAPTPTPAPAPDPTEEALTVLDLPAISLEELKKKAERFAPVKITYDESKLDEPRKKMLAHLLDAADILDGLFWQQVSADGRPLFDALAGMEGGHAELLKRYVRINYGRFDRLDGYEPFIGATHNPEGATFYPADLTKKEMEAWLAAHPEQKDAFTDEFTIIRRAEGGGLQAIPYAEFYGEGLRAAAKALRDAASYAVNASLKRYLESRAAAFESNDYYASDVDWMDLEDNLIEVTIGPYEVYEDRLFNYKAAFEAFITLNDPEAGALLASVAGYLPRMEANLPIPDAHKNQARGTESPIRVVDVIYTAGDTRAGVQTIAFNLPNDERVREAKGSKKVLLRNISDAKFDRILRPIAERVVALDQLPFVVRHAYFNHTLMHEMSHGIGPGNITLADGTKTSVNRQMKELYSTIEEAKADILGITNTFFLIDEGLFPKELEAQCAITSMAGTFRSVRFGAEEAHGKANMIVFNFLMKEGAYVYDEETGRFRVDLTKIREASRKLAHEILMVQALGDYDACKKLIDTYGEMPESMKAALAGLGDVPVDIEPIYQVEPR